MLPFWAIQPLFVSRKFLRNPLILSGAVWGKKRSLCLTDYMYRLLKYKGLEVQSLEKYVQIACHVLQAN